jgi:hypothetical protein
MTPAIIPRIAPITIAVIRVWATIWPLPLNGRLIEDLLPEITVTVPVASLEGFIHQSLRWEVFRYVELATRLAPPALKAVLTDPCQIMRRWPGDGPGLCVLLSVGLRHAYLMPARCRNTQGTQAFFCSLARSAPLSRLLLPYIPLPPMAVAPRAAHRPGAHAPSKHS